MRGSPLIVVVLAAATPFLVLTLIIAGVGFGLVAWRPPILWSRTFGDFGLNSATAIDSDSSGAYIEGYVDNSGIGYGSGSLFLTKYDPSGAIIWTRSIGNTNNSFLSKMSVGVEGIYLSGENYSSGSRLGIFQKYDLAGNKLWERDSTAGEVTAISATRGVVYVTGFSPPLTNQSYTGVVSWVREYGSMGNVVWTNEFSNETTYIGGIFASASGVYVSYGAINRTANLGPYLLKYDLNGSLAWTRQAGGAVSGDSTAVYLAGGRSILKFDPDGNQVWATQISSSDPSYPSDTEASVDPSGVYVSFYTLLGHEFLQKYDLNGNRLWSVQMQSPIRDENSAKTAFRVSASAGGVYVAGAVRSSGQLAIVSRLSGDASLVFFSLNPPWSFVLVGSLIGGAVVSTITFRRLNRRKATPASAARKKLRMGDMRWATV